MVKITGPLPIKSIVKFFAFSIIALGVIFFGEGTYFLFSYDISSSSDFDTTIPSISFAKDRKYSNYFYNSQ